METDLMEQEDMRRVFNMETELVVIDGDLISYRSAAANERRTIKVTHKRTGKQKAFENRTEFKEHLATKGFALEDYSIQDVQDCDELPYALHTAKQTIKGICDSCECSNYIVVISGKDNFRMNIPLPTQYKSNRDESIRPLQLADVKNYVLHKHPSVTALGEADDLLAEYAYKGFKEKRKIVQATIDKDGLSNMGWLFNWTKMEKPIYISGLGELHYEGKSVKGTGRKWFMLQSIVGDATDGYKPTDLCGVKFGEKGAYKLLADLKTDKECWEATTELYKSWYPAPVTYKAWDGVEYTKNYLDIMQMYVDCAHMQRWKNDRIVVTEVLDKLGITY